MASLSAEATAASNAPVKRKLKLRGAAAASAEDGLAGLCTEEASAGPEQRRRRVVWGGEKTSLSCPAPPPQEPPDGAPVRRWGRAARDDSCAVGEVSALSAVAGVTAVSASAVSATASGFVGCTVAAGGSVAVSTAPSALFGSLLGGGTAALPATSLALDSDDDVDMGDAEGSDIEARDGLNAGPPAPAFARLGGAWSAIPASTNDVAAPIGAPVVSFPVAIPEVASAAVQEITPVALPIVTPVVSASIPVASVSTLHASAPAAQNSAAGVVAASSAASIAAPTSASTAVPTSTLHPPSGRAAVDHFSQRDGPSTLLPATVGSGPQDASAEAGVTRDYSALPLRQDHARRPLWVCPDGHIVFEAFHERASQVTDFLIAIAEPVSRPEFLHEYQLTTLSLNAAVSTGADIGDVIKVLTELSKNAIDKRLIDVIREQGLTFGKLKIILRNNRHYLEASDPGLLRKLCSHPDIAASLLHPGGLDATVTGDAGTAASVEINSLRVEAVKEAAHSLRLPLQQEYEYAQDRAEHSPVLGAVLKPTANLRPYQQRALSKMFSIDGVAKSGIIVLPCGAGKTLVGIASICRVRRRTLVLTTTAVSVDQWRRQFLEYSTIAPENVYVLTADQKVPMDDAERCATVLISTYSMLGFAGKRSGQSELVLSQIQELEWGMLVVDEVQVMPARTFRTVATTVKAHCILGLTATLVREDDLIADLHWLIGPKLYEASWQQLQEDGYLARVRCVEVWCDMSEVFFAEYLQAIDNKDYPLQRALWTCNPSKLKVCEYLIRFHEHRGDKIIVFSDNIMILEEFAKKLGRYYICGKVDMRERMQILGSFKESASCNTIFLSKVGDNAIDIPCANVIIQISSHYGSRRQEAQRLGRILRPKQRHYGSGGTQKFNAFFYSLVSRDTQEMFYANRRQQFLVEQGYNYHVLRDDSVDRLESADLIYSGKDAQLRLLKQVLESVKRGEGLEAEEEEVALHQPTAKPPASATATTSSDGTPAEGTGAAGAAGAAGAGGAAAFAAEERFSLASLSGGLDGSYVARSAYTSSLKLAPKEEGST